MLANLYRRFSTPKLLYLGLGEMGYYVSGTLSKHFPTTVWNRTHTKADKHAKEYNTSTFFGANPFAHDISDIDVILSCLPTSKEVDHISDHLINYKGSKKHDLIWVDNTSGVPKESKHIAKKLDDIGVGFLDAPVSGGRVGAMKGQLAVMVGGQAKYFRKVEPVLKTLAKSLIHIDDKVGSGHAVKAYNNLLYACNLLLAMKTSQSIEDNGINIDRALKTIIAASGGSASMVRVHEYATNNRKINYNFKTSLLVKDIDIGMSMFKNTENDVVFQLFKQIRQLYFEAASTNWDHSDVFDLYSFIENK